jgi:hypothetical protein
MNCSMLGSHVFSSYESSSALPSVPISSRLVNVSGVTVSASSIPPFKFFSINCYYQLLSLSYTSIHVTSHDRSSTLAITGRHTYWWVYPHTIMVRLSALEANATLYACYVEEQTSAMREVLWRLSGDVGRLEGIGRAQAQLYQRSMSDFGGIDGKWSLNNVLSSHKSTILPRRRSACFFKLNRVSIS